MPPAQPRGHANLQVRGAEAPPEPPAAGRSGSAGRPGGLLRRRPQAGAASSSSRKVSFRLEDLFIVFERGPETVLVEAKDMHLRPLAGIAGDDRLALVVDVEHQLGRPLEGVAEQLLQYERDIAHQVDRIVP